MKKILNLVGWLLIIFLLYINLTRFFNFAFKIAGIEHDSGWYLGIAANLALKGKYASYTNLVLEGNLSGILNDMWHRPSVIGKEGLEYFPSVAFTVGPAFLVPTAIFLKLFGVGFQQFRLFPCLTYLLLVSLSIWLVFRFSGKLGVIFLLGFLNLFPQITIPIAFEGLAEPTGLFYLLFGAVLLDLSPKEKQKESLLIFLGGLFFSFAFLTKILYFFALAAIIFFWAYPVRSKAELERKIQHLFILIFGFFLPVLLFQVYRLLVLTSVAGPFAYLANLGNYLMIFFIGGSGLKENSISLADKFKVFGELGFNSWPKVFLLFLFLVYSFHFFCQGKKRKDSLLEFLLIYWLLNFLWFLFFNPTGWARHFWPGLFLTIIFLAEFLGSVLKDFLEKRNWLLFFLSILLLFLIYHSEPLSLVISLGNSANLLLSWQQKFFSQKPQGLPPPIFLLSKQKEVVSFINEKIPKEGQIYYLEGYLVAEIPSLVDRVFYSVARAPLLNSKLSYVIFSPYQVPSGWQIISQAKYFDQVKKFCGKEVFNNHYYQICFLGGGSSK